MLAEMLSVGPIQLEEAEDVQVSVHSMLEQCRIYVWDFETCVLNVWRGFSHCRRRCIEACAILSVPPWESVKTYRTSIPATELDSSVNACDIVVDAEVSDPTFNLFNHTGRAKVLR